MIERVNQELKRRSRVVRIFPNPKSCLGLFTALLKEWHEDWTYGRIYVGMDLLEEFEAEKRVQQLERADLITDMVFGAEMKHINLTTRQADSFYLFDSKYTEFTCSCSLTKFESFEFLIP